jgi:hypothetical protein
MMLGHATLLIACLAAAPQDASKESLKAALKDADVPASWIYDDISAGFAEARKSGKPMLVVFR